jgi:magnesium-transporting ATPase (P-type)
MEKPVADLQALRETPWHTRPVEEVARDLETDPRDGLTREAVEERRERFGPNAIRAADKEPWWRILLRQFLDPLIYILLVAGVIVLAVGDLVDFVVIYAVVVLNGAIGFTQELRAQKAITALAQMSAPKAHVRREGSDLDVPSEEVVPGDVVRLRSGDRVPADVRLSRAEDLQVDESALTGESAAVRKQVTPVDDARAVPGDQLSMAFAGTIVTRGRGQGVAVLTGEASQLGRIAEQTRQVGHVRTPIQEKVDRLGKHIGLAILVLAALVALIGALRGMSARDIVEIAVAMAVGAVPEALPVVLTVALAVGVRRMARRNAIIRTLPSVETLGSTTVIASDKTGTLTSNQMMVRAVWAGDQRYEVSGSGFGTDGEIVPDSDAGGDDGSGPGRPNGRDDALHMTLLAGLLANETESLQGDEDGLRGDPTELAVLVAAVKGGLALEETRREHEQLDVIPFESERRYMATLHRTASGTCVFMKGAPEAVLERCSRRLRADGEEEPLDADAARQRAHELAEEGFRVLGMAFRRVERERFEGDDVGSELTFAGFQGMEDPLRPEAKDAVEATRKAGIRVLMLTGDHLDTARAIGQRLGMAGDGREAREGRTLDDLTDDELDEVVRRTDVFARVSPSHKLKLVERLKAQGEIVAVTGDGVNDAPALRAAHLGVAMGRSGTDVAREASDVVLTDDNFASITSAVREGRLVFENLRKVTYFLLSTGLAQVLVIIASLLLGWPLPFVAVQVLWINLVTNGLQDVALAFEKAEPGLLDKPPRPPREGVIHRELVVRLITVSLLIAVATLGVFVWMLEQGRPLEEVRSVAMTQMVVFQFFHVFNSRSLRQSIFKVSLTSNPFLAFSLTGAVLAHVAVLHVPFMQTLFRTTPLSLGQWAVLAAVGALVIVAVEVEKAILRRRDRAARERRRAG